MVDKLNINPEITNNINKKVIDFIEPKNTNTLSENLLTEEINTSSSNHSLSVDISDYYNSQSTKMKLELFDRIFENEQMAFFQENHRFMNSKEKKILKKQISVQISKGLIYVDKIGKIQVRKGVNTTPKKNKKRKK